MRAGRGFEQRIRPWEAGRALRLAPCRASRSSGLTCSDTRRFVQGRLCYVGRRKSASMASRPVERRSRHCSGTRPPRHPLSVAALAHAPALHGGSTDAPLRAGGDGASQVSDCRSELPNSLHTVEATRCERHRFEAKGEATRWCLASLTVSPVLPGPWGSDLPKFPCPSKVTSTG